MNRDAKPITDLSEHRFWGRAESTRCWVKWKREHPKDIHTVHFPPEYVEP